MKFKQIPYQVAIIVTLCVYLYYLVYRVRYTINPDCLILSLSYFYAEVHGFLSLFLFFFQIWSPKERSSPPVSSGLSVDIYIPTYNEDISIIRKTALSCVNIRYPHKTYILDDGNRPELAKEAVSWGCEYIARKERADAKAGNLNHALQRTQGDYIAIFDADFIPQPNFLDKTMGYFQEEKVSFVQTPHNYYNVDSFQFRIDKGKEKSWNEQDIFYKLMMPCRDYWNSAFFTGTAAVFRRKALEDIGGIATGNITEDINTTILLYSHGWKGIYHNEILANGLAAKDLKNYQTQKLRWAEGNIGLLFTNNPLFIKGLTIPQRISFFAVIFGWLIGFPKLIYFIMPSLMILTGRYPIGSFDSSFVWRYLMFLAVILAGFKFACRGYGRVRYDECYLMINFFIFIKAALKNLFRLKSIFKVTGKGTHESISIFGIIPQFSLCLICFAGIAWGGLKLYYGVSADFMGIGTAIFWSFINGFLPCLQSNS
ncbi:MAG: glycosyltransferase [Planctomycetia bacterium]|nr:glycosyltransferase [Planctomycetia bacterium]